MQKQSIKRGRNPLKSVSGNWPRTVVASLAVLVLTGCGAAADGQDISEAQGFEFGASQEQVNEAIADLEPATLTYQSSAGSPNSANAPRAHAFKKAVEERSNGKITIDLIWGQAIAGYSELDDALTDGRVDIAFTIPIYDPSAYPAFNAMTNSFSGLPSSPLVGDTVKNTVVADVAWSSDSLLEEYESKNLTPLVPAVSSGATYSVCAESGISKEDWDGRQVRISSNSHIGAIEGLGATPVSMPFTEMYQALQRGTVDCTFTQATGAADTGILEVAPHIGYLPSESDLPAHTGGAEMAGLDYQNLPLPYKQIIFDAANIEGNAAFYGQLIDSKKSTIEQAKANGGDVTEFDSETAAIIKESNQGVREEAAKSGHLPDDFSQMLEDSVDAWQAKVAELGIEDKGTLEDVDEWWTPGSVDFTELAKAVYKDTALPHRPA